LPGKTVANNMTLAERNRHHMPIIVPD
jgi:hypothetical protein